MNNTINFKLKHIYLSVLLAVVTAVSFGVFFSSAASAASDTKADIKNSLCQGADKIAVAPVNGNECGKVSVSGNESSVNKLISKAINIFSVIVGIVAVIMIIYGGLKFITSGGDSGRITSAKQTIVYALIGLIIVALAQFIVRFVLSQTNKAVS